MKKAVEVISQLFLRNGLLGTVDYHKMIDINSYYVYIYTSEHIHLLIKIKESEKMQKMWNRIPEEKFKCWIK